MIPYGEMTKEQRVSEIVRRINANGSVLVSEVCEDFGVTERTVYRDVATSPTMERVEFGGEGNVKYLHAPRRKSKKGVIPYSEMTKAQRLVILDQRLRESGRVLVSSICEDFGIDPRTVYRDVSHLNQIGRAISFGGPDGKRFIRTMKKRRTLGNEE